MLPAAGASGSGGWPSLSPHLTPECALPLSSVFWRDRAGILFRTQAPSPGAIGMLPAPALSQSTRKGRGTLTVGGVNRPIKNESH